MKGFTLLEVMISLAIIGAVVITLIGATNYHLTLLQNEQDSTELTILGRSLIADLEAKGGIADKGDGNLSPLHPDILWSFQLLSTEIPSLKKMHLKLNRKGSEKGGILLVRYIIK